MSQLYCYLKRVRVCIRHKLQLHGLGGNDDLVGFMAESLKGDIRRMESAIIGIKAKSRLHNVPPDLNIAKEVIYGLVGRSIEITGESIRDLIGDQFRVSINDLRSRSRKRSVTFPRQMAMYLTRKYTSHSLVDIGNIYNRDHSTVLYAIKTITKDMSRETSIREQVELLCTKIKR